MKITIFILLLVSSYNFAQVNIEKYQNISNRLGLYGNLSFYISSKTGNTDVQEFGVDGRINYESKKYLSFIIGQGEYGWNKGKEYSNNALLHFRYIHRLDRIINPELFGQINYNKSKLLNFRYLTGLGLRITALSDSITNFSIGTSYMYEHEDLDLPIINLHPRKTFSHRWSSYISYSKEFTNNSRISVVVYAQPKFDNMNDIRILSENHFGIKLSDKLSLSLNFRLSYDSKPPEAVKELDTNSKFGLSISI